MSNMSFIAQSKIAWRPNGDRQATNEEIQIGCLQRIAIASEILVDRLTTLTSSYDQLKRDLEHYKNRNDENYERYQKEKRRAAALRGHIARMKRSLSGPNA
jgi:hypothetical protein